MLEPHDYLTLPTLGLVIAANLAALVGLAVGIFPRRREADWHYVGPGEMHLFGLVLGVALTLFISYIYLFVGSAREDAESQMDIALMLLLAFGACSAYLGFYMFNLRRMNLRWRGDAIRWRQGDREHLQDMMNFQSMDRTSSYIFMRFADGTILKLDPYMSKAKPFVAAAHAGVVIDHRK